MYYAYNYDICKCIMCHDNNIFESLNLESQGQTISAVSDVRAAVETDYN